MDEPRLEFEESPTAKSRQAVFDGLVAHFAEGYGDPNFHAVGLFLRDERDEVVGGLTGRFRWGWLYVEMLWVAKHLRRTGQGARLLREAEAIALEHGGVAAHLECAADALPFYQHLGYELVGVMEDFPVPGERQHFVRKWLRGG